MKTNYRRVIAPLELINGNQIDWVFAERCLIIDDATDYVVALYVDIPPRFGSSFNAVLAPLDSTLFRCTELAGTILSEIGGCVAGASLSVGNSVLDNVIPHILSRFAKTSIQDLFQNAIHAQCGYVSLTTNRFVIRRALHTTDLRDVGPA
jgi:hypothetical protein